MITAIQVYDHVQCPHRPVMDTFTPESERDEASAFTEMLWEQGIEHEAAALALLGVTADLSQVPLAERETATLAAISRKEPLIYRARLTVDDLVGEPDLLELQSNGGYIPGNIKSGGGLEDGDEKTEGRLKKHYAVQLGHYGNILERRGLGDGTHKTFVIDRDFKRVTYNLDLPQGVQNTQTWWEFYQLTLDAVQGNLSGVRKTLPALGTTCKLCHWYTRCKRDVIEANDLSLIAELGRSKRDSLIRLIPSVRALAAANIDNFQSGKKTVFPGIGPGTLEKYHARAKLLCTPNARPYLKSPISLPIREKEVYFDIEADPMKDSFVYLHGMVEREHGKPSTAVFKPFFADGDTPQDEESVFAGAWHYLTERIIDSVIYYYSRYEWTSYRRLAQKYPSVCSVDEVDALFQSPAMIDLYTDVVKRCTEWPCHDQSIKTLAVFCGFKWRDISPSGAASIEWYRRWLKTGDLAIKQRILDYNEDDCEATGWVVDEVRRMEVVPALVVNQ